MYHKKRFSQDYIIEKFTMGKIPMTEAFNKFFNYHELNIEERNENRYFREERSLELNIVEKKEKNQEDREKLNKLLEEMDSLIGLEEVKKIIREYIAFIKVQQLRERYQLKTSPVVMHMIFKGNPGTGKTTMARIIGKIFNEIGYLQGGELIEAERADLVGEYIGHTAQKTKKLLERALGGVLFIDEAYSLARGGEKDFGKESIDTIVKAMEDYKDKLIIILAGYRDEMNFFLRTNPGLASRFAIQIDFPDYTIDELVQIANLMYKEREYILDEKSKHYIYRILSEIRYKEIINGNARTVRNLVERSIRQHARRIIKQKNISKKDLIYITKEDLIGEEGNNEKMPCNRDA
ncbi:MAG TPA: AAA family ATPase [Halanaerobiales bacterium]|nr:AAA family ATPase [Halanaerobiales bacterium]HPZ63305.1 AAA family ATPase [Halanaerobiales bacterium]HQD04555.1 AAA family ATPase [Halanaerobiales bacterium]